MPASTRRRRSGPAGEEPWWDTDDQSRVEAPLLHRRELGRGWIPARLVNNAEQLDPHGAGPDADELRARRSARTLTALDEGGAWRHRRTSALLVARVEAFARADDGAHRLAWRERGASSLDALWRQRYRERDIHPGWIEARWLDHRDRVPPLGVAGTDEEGRSATGSVLDPVLSDAVDWIRIEDQTSTSVSGRVMCFEHLTVWAGRGLATLVVRHDQVDDLSAMAAAAAATAHGRLSQVFGSDD